MSLKRKRKTTRKNPKRTDKELWSRHTELGLGHRRRSWSFAINLGCRNWLESSAVKHRGSKKGLKKTKKNPINQDNTIHPKKEFFFPSKTLPGAVLRSSRCISGVNKHRLLRLQLG